MNKELGRVPLAPGSREPSPMVSALRASIPHAGLSWTWRNDVIASILDRQESENDIRPDFTPAISRERIERAVSGLMAIYDCRPSDTASVYGWLSLWDALGVDFFASKMVFQKEASAIEAGTAETGTGSVHESAGLQGDAQTPPKDL